MPRFQSTAAQHSMIRLESISKQNGKQIIFIEASAAPFNVARRSGWWGRNGAGKTTLFA
jgi:ATPase subunit of ABC transporter with duplicated ATPase domains